ncbi:MAG TPA: hypothetical protein VMG80_08260 [Solirubrobacteraceae bacterium]|nr:hypothetical protein [Solirubrobacteraceae bacterium]
MFEEGATMLADCVADDAEEPEPPHPAIASPRISTPLGTILNSFIMNILRSNRTRQTLEVKLHASHLNRQRFREIVSRAYVLDRRARMRPIRRAATAAASSLYGRRVCELDETIARALQSEAVGQRNPRLFACGSDAKAVVAIWPLGVRTA